VRGDGDGWARCARGHRHWGVFGAAGLLLWHDGAVLLQHRAEWSHHGGTWGIPGGARHPDESAEQAALREAHEEAGIDPAAVALRGSSVLEHPDWSYTTVLADELVPVHPTVTDAESDEIRWVPLDEVETLPLLPAFAEAWPALRARITARA
jgi:8-oxo-dGTP pyrophosphatase MutT (NUDIX family)